MTSVPLPIRPKPNNHARALEIFLSPSYLSPSPIAQAIIAMDVVEREDGHLNDSDSASEVDPDITLDAPLMSRPSGIAYGTLRPTIAADAPGTPALTPRDIAQSRHAERSLLRDNHILPPKHPRPFPFEEAAWKRLYRRLFSTKVPIEPLAGDDEYDSFGPMLSRVSTKALETTPLLASPSDSETQLQWDAAVAANVLKTTWQREAQTLGQYSRALIVTFLLHYSVTVTSVFTVGRIGRVELGAVSLATMSANITCYAPIQGLSTALDTVCAQAYGSGHRRLVGLQLQRMTYLLWLLLVPIGILWWFSGQVLARIIPDAETAALAGGYLRILILGTPGVAAFESGKRFVQAQGLFHATTMVLLVGAPLNILANWFFVWKLGWGFPGAAAAVIFTQNLLPFLLLLYVCFIEGRECWGGLNRKAFRNWGESCRLVKFAQTLTGVKVP